MNVSFAASPQSSVGVEWELHLVDLDTLELTPAAAPLLERVRAVEGGPIRKEYLQCVIEIVSQPRQRVAEAIADIGEQLDLLREAAADLNVGLVGAGSHPFSHPMDQEPFHNQRYDVVTEHNQYWARQMAICGTHVHVGIAKRDDVLPVTWTYGRFYPYLLALSASSPFWDGIDTGYASQRTMLFQQLPTNGLPFKLKKWSQFEKLVEDQVQAGMISEVNELRWDVRPSPKFGTVENRIPDSAPTLKELACEAALTQSLGEYFARALAEGDTPDYLPPWLVRENKWRAARYGLDAEVITPNPDERILPLRHGLENLLNFLAPYADDLGCADELAVGHDIIARGAPYERQRAWVRDGADLREVARRMLQETAANTPIAP
ncbi:MAG: glutamate--cysteine ligase [Propionibacteriaceae bacterium]|nr:glutamate--cysteine ligase [Propionibacteriaceae bacterium]